MSDTISTDNSKVNAGLIAENERLQARLAEKCDAPVGWIGPEKYKAACESKMKFFKTIKELREQNEKLQARVAELECMVRAFRACVDIQMVPSWGNPGEVLSMKELLEAGVPIPICRAVIEQAGNATGNDAQQVIIRQQKALCLMTLVLYDIRMTIPRIGPDLDRISQQVIDNAGTADQMAERLERETWGADQ